ncbi:MAG: exo-alpha-sialidase [Deltaproteobacteria bacterium]|nr:exo-alpha-sialidase [Deltaproteobacteria bacterium]
MDVFIVEASSALNVTWNVNGTVDHAGGFKIESGTATGAYTSSLAVSATAREALLAGLRNGAQHFVAVRALDSAGATTFTSCEVFARPHVLVFQEDLRVNSGTSGTQQRPALASNLEGTRLYLAWDDAGTVTLAHSADFGDTWSAGVAVSAGGKQANPSVAVRESIVAGDGGVVVAEAVLIAWDEGGQIRVARFLPSTAAFETATTVGAGTRPSVAVGPDAVHLAYENGDGIYHTRSTDEGRTWLTPVSIGGGTTEAHSPSAVVNQFTGDVYVAWDAKQGPGDTNVYFAGSKDKGATFAAAARVDDDSAGQNQANISLAVDERSQKIYATWEDRRGGASVRFTWSEDWGATFKPSIDVGAGLGGDQFHPRATIDPARNVYVAFQDTTNGARVVFSRFSSGGTFDPPLSPSRSAGSGGVAADFPAVATDRHGTVYVAWRRTAAAPSSTCSSPARNRKRPQVAGRRGHAPGCRLASFSRRRLSRARMSAVDSLPGPPKCEVDP